MESGTRRKGAAAAVRRMVTDLNVKIAAAIRVPLDGPPLNLMPYDVEAAVETWRRRAG
jgi:hypothetical protein